jgi:HD-GYP domain-containing protein (c-di-GMP phosphodiesterase class II)
MGEDTQFPQAWFSHSDSLAMLGEKGSFPEKLRHLHGYLSQRYPSIDRVAVALYDAGNDVLKTFAYSGAGENPLPLYEAKLADTPALMEVKRRRQPRLIAAIAELAPATTHTASLLAHGYRSSYTIPILRSGEFIGFLFFNSLQEDAFDDATLHHLDLIGHLIALLVADEVATVQTLIASVRSTTTLAQHRDFETGAHLDRMAHYARLIARDVAPECGLDDEAVEHIFLFAPLHDIGKIGIPDEILRKPGRLSAEERATMKTHAEEGGGIIDALLAHFGMEGLPHASVLRNIARCHHEAMNGQGYPAGLSGEQIPLEARIIAVADIFDALTSRRPYKEAWSNDDAFAELRALAGEVLDRRCVEALVGQRAQVEEIQLRFNECSRD